MKWQLAIIAAVVTINGNYYELLSRQIAHWARTAPRATIFVVVIFCGRGKMLLFLIILRLLCNIKGGRIGQKSSGSDSDRIWGQKPDHGSDYGSDRGWGGGVGGGNRTLCRVHFCPRAQIYLGHHLSAKQKRVMDRDRRLRVKALLRKF